MNYYPHHIGDFDRATRHLTRIERSVYRDLLDVYYETEQRLTLNLPALCRKIIASTNEEVTAVEQTLNEFFTKTPTGWYHERCEEELDRYRKSTSQKSVAGKASAAKRALKHQQALNEIATGVEHTLNGTPANQEPITNNHEPVTTKASRAAGYSAKDDLLEVGVDPQTADDWLALRKAKKATVTKTAIDGIKREVVLAGISLGSALSLCCERGWAGFKAEWVQGQARTSPGSGNQQLGPAGQATAQAAARLMARYQAKENEPTN